MTLREALEASLAHWKENLKTVQETSEQQYNDVVQTYADPHTAAVYLDIAIDTECCAMCEYVRYTCSNCILNDIPDHCATQWLAVYNALRDKKSKAELITAIQKMIDRLEKEISHAM